MKYRKIQKSIKIKVKPLNFWEVQLVLFPNPGTETT